MYKVLTLNNISVAGLECLPREDYEVASEIQHPDAILVRSAKMHEMEVPDTLKCIGRAGAGTNNIPVEKMSSLGIPVFNAPGANANAVKELVLTGMLLACRNICPAWEFARNLEGTDAEINKATEAGKKNYVGFELPGRTLGVIGLGAIGVRVANAALSLGMRVIGFDPHITVARAWELSAEVQQAESVEDVLAHCDFVTLHVPLIDATKDLINETRIKAMKPGATVLNFSRAGIVNDEAIVEAINNGVVHAYVCDFPSNALKGNANVITLPHLGASTTEAEENCAVMVANQIRDYLEHGHIRNSVNFPEVYMSRSEGHRLAIVNANVPNMLGQISTDLANAGLNIIDMLNKSRGEIAYTLVDVDAPIPETTIKELEAIDGVLAVRLIGASD